MCDVCDGMTWAEIERRNDLLIRVCGFMIQSVEGPAPWSYTVGLTETCDAPEFVVLDGCGHIQARLLKKLGDHVVEHGSVTSAILHELDVALCEPFVADLEAGLVAQWESRYTIAARSEHFRQLLLGPSWET